MLSLLFFSSLLILVKSSEILFITTTPLYGPQMALQPIYRDLSKSHQVTVVTPNPISDPTLKNLTEIDIKFVYELSERKFHHSEGAIRFKDEPIRYSNFFYGILRSVNEEVLDHPDVAKLIFDESLKFDLVIVEFIVPTMLAFGHRFKCPIIAISPTEASTSVYNSIGNPTHPGLNPDAMLKFSSDLSFMQRVFSTITSITRKISSGLLLNVEDEIVKKRFGLNYPSLGDTIDRISIFLMNVNPNFHGIRPNVPAIVNFGGEMTIGKRESRSGEDVRGFLDSGETVIYFSLGTVLKVSSFTEDFLRVVFRTFANLPYKFLVKLDLPDEFPGKPDNVIVKPWFSQQEILSHPNVRLFVTQCGLQSIEESIHYNVPIIGLPFFGDQFSNCLKAERKGIGRVFDVNKLDSGLLTRAIEEVLNNPTYEEKTKVLSKVISDEPLRGVDKAIWWIEHVLRHKGAKHLRAPSLDVPFWKFYLLDVIGFVVFVVLATLFLMTKCVGICVGKVRKSGKKSKKQ